MINANANSVRSIKLCVLSNQVKLRKKNKKTFILKTIISNKQVTHQNKFVIPVFSQESII